MYFEDRVSVVTGAGRGIGLAIAGKLGREGSTVVICDIAKERGQEAASMLRSQGIQAHEHALDVTCADACHAMTDVVMERFGQIDVLVNNAGVVIRQNVETITEDDWDAQHDVNLKGVLFCCQAVAQAAMIPQGRGSIVNIASISGHGGAPLRLAYYAAKAAVLSMTRSLATEWARFNIRVNSVSPGITRTDLVDVAIQSGRASLELYRHRIPLGRLAEVHEIASAVAFLASDRASFITGDDLLVDGGLVPWANPYGCGWPAEGNRS